MKRPPLKRSQRPDLRPPPQPKPDLDFNRFNAELYGIFKTVVDAVDAQGTKFSFLNPQERNDVIHALSRAIDWLLDTDDNFDYMTPDQLTREESYLDRLRVIRIRLEKERNSNGAQLKGNAEVTA